MILLLAVLQLFNLCSQSCADAQAMVILGFIGCTVGGRWLSTELIGGDASISGLQSSNGCSINLGFFPELRR